MSVPSRVRAGASELLGDVTDGSLGDVRSLIVAPLASQGQVVGALWLGISASGRRYDVDDLMLVEELARRAALAVENARLYEDRRRVADTLQASLLPPTLPSVPGVDVGAAYRASGEGNDIGGDFYDVFEIGGGAWAAVIGDVCGKGTGAAALTGLARHTLRAAALRRGSAERCSQPAQRSDPTRAVRRPFPDRRVLPDRPDGRGRSRAVLAAAGMCLRC